MSFRLTTRYFGIPKDNRVLHMSSKSTHSQKLYCSRWSCNSYVSVVFNTFLIDQLHDHNLVTCFVVFPETCWSLAEFLLVVPQHALYNGQHYFAGMGDKCNSSIVVAVHSVPFLVDRHIDGSSQFRWPLSFSNDLMAQVSQLCHHLKLFIDGLHTVYVKIVRPGWFVVGGHTSVM